MTKLLLLELNELRFDDIEKYIERGILPNFKKLFDTYGYTKTLSETDQGVLNPWVQWPTAHSGLDYAEHGIRRLSEIQDKDHPQIWDKIESMGHSVAALVAFNASNKTKNASFFVADPWTRTHRVAPKTVEWADDALKQITHDYANGRVKLSSYLKILGSMMVNMQWKHIPAYFKYGSNYLRGRKWHRALFCDLLFADIFVKMYQKDQPDFATVFVNAGAHLQHHYLFSSKVYEGPFSNPDWYCEPGQDPVEDALRLYDQLLGELTEKLQGVRIMIATGLSQDPHDRISYYYRLEDHHDFLTRAGVPYSDIQPLMTEDFLVRFDSKEKADTGRAALEAVHSQLDQDIFYVHSADDDVRDDSVTDRAFYIDQRDDTTLYVQLRPSKEQYPEGFALYSNANKFADFNKQVSFVSIKNAGHNGRGYFIDTGMKKGEMPESMPLRDIYNRVVAVFEEADGKTAAPKVVETAETAELKRAA